MEGQEKEEKKSNFQKHRVKLVLKNYNTFTEEKKVWMEQ